MESIENSDKDKGDNSNMEHNQSKSFNFVLKQMKNNKTGQYKYFDKLTDVLLSFQLFPFLKEEEIKSYGCLNIKFYNGFMRYCKRRFDSLIPEYNININNNECINQNELYEQKDDKGHYIKFGLFKVYHYSLFGENLWTWRDDKRYWEKKKVENSILNKEVYNLLQVCWVDVNQTITHVFYGKYKLYLNHCICNINKSMLKLKVLLDGVTIFERDYPSQEEKDKCRERHIKNNEEDKKDDNNKPGYVMRERFGRFRGLRIPMRFQHQEVKSKRVDKDFITDIDIPYDENIEKNKGHTITVRFDQIEDSWKHGWMIDAFILEKIIGNTDDK